MSIIDWLLLLAFIGFIVGYGTWKSRKKDTIDDYLRAGRRTPWWAVALSIMATQASAITFLSTPGQAYADGMRFLQFYIGLPIAMIILCITAVPLYSKLNVYTAYEYLENRFDLKSRLLGSILFLSQRGLAAGFTIYAPSLILSVILGWELNITIIIVGLLVIVYTSVGGSDAVNKTHLLQMIVITFGMFAAFAMIYISLPNDVSVIDAAYVAGKMGKLNAIDFSFDLSNRYSFWSGILGGTFLMLSYFGTDQSQVQRYLSAKNITQSRMALIVNGLVKVPMQFIILFIGAMVFVLFQFIAPPLFFNPVEVEKVKSSEYASEYSMLENNFNELHTEKRDVINEMLNEIDISNDEKVKELQNELNQLKEKETIIKEQAKDLIKKADPDADTSDINYIFITFIIGFLPVGLVGIVIAAILSASMSSTSAELNSLASTTVIDIYKRLFKKNADDKHYLRISRISTIVWGFYAIGFALLANQLGSLVEAVNILGSLVYGTILGIFLTAFYIKKVNGNAVFIAAIIAELLVLYCYFFTEIPFLWFNVIGCLSVIFISLIIQLSTKSLKNYN